MFLALLMVAGFLAVWIAREILLVALLGVLFAVALVPAIDWMEKRHIQRGFGILIFLGLITALYFLVGSAAAGLAGAGEIQEKLPRAMERTCKSIRAAIPGADLPPAAEAQEKVSASYGDDMGALGSRGEWLSRSGESW